MASVETDCSMTDDKMLPDEIKTELNDDSNRSLDITLNNVVCSFSVRCHLNLKQIAMNGFNVEFHKEMAVSTKHIFSYLLCSSYDYLFKILPVLYLLGCKYHDILI